MGEIQRAVHAPRLELNAESAREWLDSDGMFGDLNEKERRTFQQIGTWKLAFHITLNRRS